VGGWGGVGVLGEGAGVGGRRGGERGVWAREACGGERPVGERGLWPMSMKPHSLSAVKL